MPCPYGIRAYIVNASANPAQWTTDVGAGLKPAPGA